MTASIGDGKLVVLKLLQRARRIQRRDDEVPGPPQDGLAGRGLDRVVVDQQHGRRTLRNGVLRGQLLFVLHHPMHPPRLH
jgi:hypothetical protein